MGTPIYKITEYVDWKGTSAIYSGASAGGGFVTQPVTEVLDGSGVAGQVAFWLDNNTLVGDAGLTYEVDSAGIGTLQVDGLGIQGDLIDAQDGHLKHLTIAAGDAYGTAGSDAGDLKLKAGNALTGDNGSVSGNIYLVPGCRPDVTNNYLGRINLGDASFKGDTITFDTYYCYNANVDLGFYAKGSGSVNFLSMGGHIAFLASTYVSCETPELRLGSYGDDPLVLAYDNNMGRKGSSLKLQAGKCYSQVGQNWDGGDILLNVGAPSGTGVTGYVYLGDRNSGALKAKTSETNVVYYDPATGKLSYGDGSGLSGAGGTLWQEDSIGDLSPITAGADIYAHDFILIP
jgi:hypothetical protein